EPGMVPNGYTSNDAWNLNPVFYHADGRLKDKDFLAATAVKTSTDRSGVAISPYNHANVTEGLSFDTNELNQCEPGYVTTPDLASKGTFQNSVLLDLSAAQRYTQICPEWVNAWSIPTAAVQTVGSCTQFPLATDGSLPLLALNLSDGTVNQRCPAYR